MPTAGGQPRGVCGFGAQIRPSAHWGSVRQRGQWGSGRRAGLDAACLTPLPRVDAACLAPLPVPAGGNREWGAGVVFHQASTTKQPGCCPAYAGDNGEAKPAKQRAVEGGFECFLASDASAVVEHTKK